MSYTHFWIDFATLLTTINPVAVVPLYLTLTAGLERRERLRALRKATLSAGGILLVFLIAGEPVLGALGVTLGAFRIAGGLILMFIGLRMVFADSLGQQSKREDAQSASDIAIFPLAMPFIAGPGVITSIVLLTENDLHTLPEQVGTACTMCLVLALCYGVLRAADTIQRLLGSTGMKVVGQISGLLVTSLAVETMTIGLRNVFPGWQ